MKQADSITYCDEVDGFTLLQEGNIPDFVQSSPYLLSLLENEKLPACGIKVPSKSLKQNTDICSKSNLFEFLHTMRYWMLPDETLYTSPGFLPFCFDPRNIEAITEACDEFGTEITEIVGLSLVVRMPDSAKLPCASLNCDLPVVKYLCEVMHLVVCNEAAHCAIKADKVSLLRYFKRCGYKYRSDSVEVAISGGHLQSLQYLSEEFPLKFYSSVWACAARSGQILSMHFLLKIGSTPDRSTYTEALQEAASNSHVSCIEFLWQEFAHLNDVTSLLRGALRGGHLEVLKLAVAEGADLTNAFRWFDDANTPGHFACLNYLYEAGIKPDVYSFRNVASKGSPECIQLMLDRGYALSTEVCVWLARGGNVEGLKLVRSAGCPWDKESCTAAAQAGHLACLQYLHENGCPWDHSTCIAAARDGHLSCLQYAHENGCPWKSGNEPESESGGRISQCAAQARTLHCLHYVVEHGAALNCDVMRLAMEHASEEKVRFLLSHHCPCDARATRTAASKNFLYLLMLLHEGGCPWDGSLFVVAGRLGHLECVQYAYEHGCPWPDPSAMFFLSQRCRAYMILHGCPGAENTLTEGSVV